MTTLKFEDILEGALNFRSWKVKDLNLLEEKNIDDYVARVISNHTDVNRKEAYKKNQAKENIILFDLVKDHFIPIISQLKTVKECYDALTSLFKMKNPSRKRDLKSKLHDIKMMKADTIST